MWQRRAAVILGVLALHGAALHYLLHLPAPRWGAQNSAALRPEPITLLLRAPQDTGIVSPEPLIERSSSSDPATATLRAAGTETSPAPPDSDDRSAVDWHEEMRAAVKRTLEAEAESERVAKRFTGPRPGGWPSLARRPRSKLKPFRWIMPHNPMEITASGEVRYWLNDRCYISPNQSVPRIMCATGKIEPNGELFEDMREYFDERRLPDAGP